MTDDDLGLLLLCAIWATLFTPPVIVILMTLAPRRIWVRTALRQASAPSQTESLLIAGWRSSAIPTWGSAWPLVAERLEAASTIRGPSTRPEAVASRKAPTAGPPPRLRTVVNPASNVFRPLARAWNTRCELFDVTSSTSPALPPRSLSRWT